MIHSEPSSVASDCRQFELHQPEAPEGGQRERWLQMIEFRCSSGCHGHRCINEASDCCREQSDASFMGWKWGVLRGPVETCC